MGLVQDQDAVGAQQQVALQLAQQDAVRHEFHGCVFAHLTIISHLRMAGVTHVGPLLSGNLTLLLT